MYRLLYCCQLVCGDDFGEIHGGPLEPAIQNVLVGIRVVIAMLMPYVMMECGFPLLPFSTLDAADDLSVSVSAITCRPRSYWSCAYAGIRTTVLPENPLFSGYITPCLTMKYRAWTVQTKGRQPSRLTSPWPYRQECIQFDVSNQAAFLRPRRFMVPAVALATSKITVLLSG